MTDKVSPTSERIINKTMWEWRYAMDSLRLYDEGIDTTEMSEGERMRWKLDVDKRYRRFKEGK